MSLKSRDMTERDINDVRILRLEVNESFRLHNETTFTLMKVDSWSSLVECVNFNSPKKSQFPKLIRNESLDN